MSFADLEARLNSAVSARLSNVEANIDGVLIPGYFSNGYSDQLGMAGRQPALSVLHSYIPEIEVGQDLELGENSYTVVDVQPDGTGMVLLVLRRV